MTLRSHMEEGCPLKGALSSCVLGRVSNSTIARFHAIGSARHAPKGSVCFAGSCFDSREAILSGSRNSTVLASPLDEKAPFHMPYHFDKDSRIGPFAFVDS